MTVAQIVQPIVAQLNAFTALSEDDVQQLIHDSTKRSCSLDPLPTSVALDYVDILLPVITKNIHLSLISGQFTEEPCAISVGNDTITASTQVKNLGCWLDSHLNMSKHVTSVCKSAFFPSS